MFSNRMTTVLLSLIITLSLNACGGGANNSTNPSIVLNESPQEISEENWQTASLISLNSSLETNLEIIGTEMVIEVDGTDLNNNGHIQVYLNTDNDASTGFQFDGEAWDESGIDYIIEDGYLYKSTANDSGWNWDNNAGAINYTNNEEKISINIDLSLLGNVCNNVKIGVMTRDENWDMSTFYPTSSRMKNTTVSFCNTTVVDVTGPEINLIGAQPLYLTVGDTLNDPGATAYDNIDGDVSNSITATSTVDTSTAGIYRISYTATDLSGNEGSFSRIVIVNAEPPQGIVIDGETDDWEGIRELESTDNGILKITDDEEKLYILVESENLGENTQILLETDSSSETGLRLGTIISEWQASVDFMIENNSLDKSTSNSGRWSWDYNAAPLEFIKTANTIEVAIKKSDFGFLSNSIRVGYISRDSDWNANYILPNYAMPGYGMSSPSAPNPVNAFDDEITVIAGTEVAIDVLENDISSTGGPIRITSVKTTNSTNISNGTMSILNNKLVYKASNVLTGNDTFTYNIKSENGDTDTATLNIKVPASNPPIARDDSATTAEGNAVTIDVLDNDTSNSESGWLFISNLGTPSNGTVQIVNGQIVYTPSVGFNGTEVFNYTITDSNGNTATAIITVKVEAILPVARHDYVSTQANLAITIDPLANDTSNSGSNNLTVTSVSNTLHGTATIITNNKIVYTPNAGHIGTDSFTYTITDSNGETATAIVTVSIEGYVQPEALNDLAITHIESAVTVNPLENDTSNSGSGQLTISNVGTPANGTAQIINNSQIIYVPNPGFNGFDSFMYTITDSNGETASAKINVSIINTNTPPVANDDIATTVETNEELIQILRNDTDPDGDNLTIINFTQGSNGTVTHNPISSFVRYTANTGFLGTDTFSYTISDSNGGLDTAMVTVVVTQNNPPVANDDFVTTDGINTLRVFVENNDSDPDDGGVNLNNDYSQPNNGTVERNTPHTLDYTPNPTFSGTDSFTYSISDRNGVTASATVFVTVPENNTPDAVEDVAGVFYNQTVTVNVLQNDTDPDNDTLSVQSIVQPTIGTATLNTDGSIFFDPQNTVGSISIGYTVSDGRGGTDFAVLTIASTDPNDGNDAYPDITNENVSIPKNTAIFIDVLANDSDADGDILVLDQVDQGQNGITAKVTQNGILGILYTPNPEFVGTDEFYYGVHDGHGHNGAGIVTVTVNP